MEHLAHEVRDRFEGPIGIQLLEAANEIALDVAAVVRQAEFFHVDGVVVTGDRTGACPDPRDLVRVRDAAAGPVWIGSGMTPENIATFAPLADGFIVGSTLRTNGAFLEELDADRLARFVVAFREAVG